MHREFYIEDYKHFYPLANLCSISVEHFGTS
jgi:hypothetical protein